MDNFYILSGDTTEIGDYFQEQGYEHLTDIDKTFSHVVISTKQQFYFFIPEHWIKQTKNRIKIQAREKCTEVSFKDFKTFNEAQKKLILNQN